MHIWQKASLESIPKIYSLIERINSETAEREQHAIHYFLMQENLSIDSEKIPAGKYFKLHDYLVKCLGFYYQVLSDTVHLLRTYGWDVKINMQDHKLSLHGIIKTEE